MTFNKTNIKKYKGSRVRINYTRKGIPSNLTGVITYNLTETLIFKVNNQTEMPIRYDNIVTIDKIKSFASYIKKAENYFESGEYQKALDVVFELKEFKMFKLPEQKKEINKIISDCKVELFTKVRES